MKIIKLEEDILIYQFNPEEDQVFLGLNIFVILNGSECVIVDTGFKRHFLKISEDLKKKGIKISKVILTHFHPDHIGGLSTLKDIQIVGSKYASDTLKLYVEDYQNYLPTRTVDSKLSIDFGRHTFILELNEGHSKDGLLIALNDKYLFVGDDVICDNKGLPSIPYCSNKEPQAHINSINKIMSKLKNNIILPTHGAPMKDKDVIIKDLINRLTYLHYINDNRTASYIDFFNETNINFLGRDWHVLNQIEEVKK